MNINEKSLRDYVFGVDTDAGIEILQLPSRQAFKISGRKADREEFATVIEAYLDNEQFEFDTSDGSSFYDFEKQQEEHQEAVAELLFALEDAALVDELYAEYEERYAHWEDELADA
ncbi:hypothetical protein [Massilia sp. NP310]|uniref:hypothetical protein n=1 Tax=Massilia sp. NP310 TaxID=2861282 RepID=UPI001C62EF96|nr:hypothetical protein [Massilia sp. NP310]QYG04036.1 hypothetical protein KY496_11960 [Massilia sp. NP310]